MLCLRVDLAAFKAEIVNGGVRSANYEIPCKDLFNQTMLTNYNCEQENGYGLGRKVPKEPLGLVCWIGLSWRRSRLQNHVPSRSSSPGQFRASGPTCIVSDAPVGSRSL